MLRITVDACICILIGGVEVVSSSGLVGGAAGVITGQRAGRMVLASCSAVPESTTSA